MRTIYILAILVLLAVAVPASPAQAGGVVTVCDEAHLRAALAGGGTVTFTCSGTITLTAEIVIAADTRIDGSGQEVTISGNNAVRVFRVNSGVEFNLDSLTIANGYIGSGSGGGIASSASIMTIRNCNFSGNDHGSIYSEQGTLTIDSSTFSNNRTTGGYAGAIYNNAGTASVSNSTFSGNSATWVGGAIHNALSSTMTVSNSTFSGDSANYGGGINNNGILTVSNCTFSNHSVLSGGAIANSCMLTVQDSSFYGNLASYNGGGIYNGNLGTVVVNNSIFGSNRASNGGGIYNAWTSATTVVGNSTFSGNYATGSGGAIQNDYHGAVTLINSSISSNRASNGGGISNGEGSMIVKNSIVANSPTGNNCSGTITDGGGNLSFPDTTCPGINADPLLGPLQDNGGPTWTMALGEGSAAIDAALDAICAAPPVNNLDQRGFVRPWGAHCDIGAVEQVQEPVAVRLSTINAGSTPGTIPPIIVFGLFLVALASIGTFRRVRQMRYD